ncbi:hypothetical protein C8A00DRAFT_41334 [Chaetomidium leptoderma]|uniref:Ig-like domain-containing protein n=1 Tax=Chaetomidium leptoderma TaxID=669021 RepID=A0AAN6VRD6_9PEZI|nr:hypothetical protein C8A00DRAFT_41334 [Chaetomidium leptoderma]
MDPGKPNRWWLPGPPPPRRLISLHDVEESYRLEGIPELAVPVRSVTLRGPLTAAGPLAPYTGQLGRPVTDPQGAPVAAPAYLFHGCGEPVSPEVIRSFARRGPSIRCSRSSSYFSPRPAVYWSNSVEFAIAWSLFARTGSWGLDQADREDRQSFECLIFVSRLDLGTAKFDGGLYMIPRPQTPEEEEELGQWCEQNMNRGDLGHKRPAPPPKSHRADWGVIGSRIPRSTMQSLTMFREKTDKIWLFAACNYASSRAIAEASVEILHITGTFQFTPATESTSNLSKL